MTKTLTLKKLIIDRKFDYVNSDIKKSFIAEEPRGDDYKLFHFDRYISSENAIKEMEKAGYLPVNLTELLLWKDWNEKDWVVALGSVAGVGGDRYVPYLDGSDSERNLGLRWFDYGWDARCRFLAVRNSSLKSSDTGTSALGNYETLTLPDTLTINGIIYKKA